MEYPIFTVGLQGVRVLLAHHRVARHKIKFHNTGEGEHGTDLSYSQLIHLSISVSEIKNCDHERRSLYNRCGVLLPPVLS